MQNSPSRGVFVILMYMDIAKKAVIIGALGVAFFGVTVFADQGGVPNNNANAAAAGSSNAQVCPGPASAGDARCHARVVTDKGGSPSTTVLPAGLSPAQMQAAYNLPSATAGAGMTVAIVDAYNDPNIESDLAVYSSTYGLPPCTTQNGCFKKVNQIGGGSYPGTNAGWSLEIALDVETVHATCPQCRILLVEASSNSFANLLVAEDYATANAQAVSNSWGGNEFSSETSASYDGHFNRPGVAITVSSGDSGYGAEYPAASRYVTAVGGTSLKMSGTTVVSESAWGGAGSGCSAYEAKQLWQTDPGCGDHRTIADVSAVADPNTGAAVYDSVRYSGRAGWFKVGGTSLASPLVAAVYALSGNTGTSATPANSLPYMNLSGIRDIVGGSNGSCGGSYLCTALVGYDGPTGLGSPVSSAAF